MSDLIVLAFDSEDGAIQLRDKLAVLQKQQIIQLEDAAVVIRRQDGKVKVKQAVSLVGAGALGGAFWGMLIGLIFWMPWLGLAMGALGGALGGKFTDIGVDGATYKALEFAGPGVKSVPVNERLTVANMAIEAGGKAGIFPADEITLDYLGGRVRGDFQAVHPDKGAEYEKEMSYDLSELDYMVAMPHSPGNGRPVEEVDVPIDQAYLGSCTNGRIEDLRTAAKLLKGRKINPSVRMIVVPASTRVYEQALNEGLLQIFIDAGAFVSGPTCGACLGGYMGILASGEKCVSSTNRNFIGRMGHKDSEVYLASPSVVAASAIAGSIATPEAVE